LRHYDRMGGHEADLSYYEPDALTWLQGWYATQCDGGWEHENGLMIETTDNPGWFLKIDVRRTAMAGLIFAKREVHRSKHDWLIARSVEDRFEVACGPLNLGEAIHQFRLWVAEPGQGESQATDAIRQLEQ
jgi:hypothetical protein